MDSFPFKTLGSMNSDPGFFPCNWDAALSPAKILNSVARSAPTFGSKIMKHKPTANKPVLVKMTKRVCIENLFIRNYINSNLFEKKSPTK